LPSAGHTAHAAGHSDAHRPGARAAATEPPFAAPGVPTSAVLHDVAAFGCTLQRSLVQSFAKASLAASLDGVRVPVLLAQVRARTRLAPPHVVEPLAWLEHFHLQPVAPASANGTR